MEARLTFYDEFFYIMRLPIDLPSSLIKQANFFSPENPLKVN